MVTMCQMDIRCVSARALVGIVLLLQISTVFAQGQPPLSAEQQRMLDQLPPAQREQALRALRGAAGNAGDEQQTSSLVEELSADLPEASDPAENLQGSVVRAGPGSRLVIDLVPAFDLTDEELQAIEDDPVLSGVSGSRYYELDRFGALTMPGLPEISLVGLSAEQIQLRLDAEPALRSFEVLVSILESLEPISADLEPFGYDVFESEDYGLQPVVSGPVPPDYVLGPGDSLRVQLFGNSNRVYELEVSRDGILNLPELGPVTVAGLTFSQFRDDLNRRVEEMLIGAQVSVTIGTLRTIRVFVLGDANRPGSYVVSSLATISSALYASGGISRIGSLRRIELKRRGETVARLDLYDLLLAGDNSGDVRLQPGDVIFVPPVGGQVGVGGSVKRPAVYETKSGATVADVVALAGGLTSDAFPGGTRVERIDAAHQRTVLSVSLSEPADAQRRVSEGDTVFVPDVLPRLERTVVLRGHVYRPGPYQWFNGMRLTQLIGSATALKPGADQHYLLVRRENPESGLIQTISANLAQALAAPGTAANVTLLPRDEVHVFDLSLGRQRVVEPILEELQLQSSGGAPYREVSISGQVRAPGTYPLEGDMRVSDLIRAGGNLTEDAYTLKAELVRYAVVGGEYRSTEVIDIELGSVLRGGATSDVVLEEHDHLRISGLPDWDSLWSITLEGEVKFPGEYRIRRGETLAQVLERAGGLTDEAFAEGAIFLRESLRQREQEQIEILARRLESDLTSLSLESLDTTGNAALTTGRELLSQLRNTEAVGRLVIDLDQSLSESGIDGAGYAALELRDEDRLLVPKQAQEVTVLGETQQNTSHLHRTGLSRDDYIAMSGGLTRRADKRLIYIVRASGAVVTGSRSRWFRRGGGTEIRPGDTIVVPLETDRIRPLTFWTNVTQILYQAAIAIAAVDTFGD